LPPKKTGNIYLFDLWNCSWYL